LGSVSDPHWLYADPDTDSGKIWTSFLKVKETKFFFVKFFSH
jgi:hypothetical protein